MVTAHLCMFMSPGIASVSYLQKVNEGRWWRRRQATGKNEEEDPKAKQQADIL